METRAKKFTCASVNQMDMVDFLSTLGHQPIKIKNQDHWYFSPFREETDASFKVNRTGNVWYDHGMGKGGTLIDFAIRYYHCSVSELLDSFNHQFIIQPPTVKMVAQSKKNPTNAGIKIINASRLHAISLLAYLNERRINEAIASQYCHEVTFEMDRRKFIAIGFANDKGGFELRNQWFKGSSSPKAITSFHNGSKLLSVFEGFFDFLTYQTIYNNETGSPSDFLILNSVAFFEASIPLMLAYDCIRLFLDRDTSGQNCIRKALQLSPKFRDESSLYNSYKDLNDWVQNIGKASP